MVQIIHKACAECVYARESMTRVGCLVLQCSYQQCEDLLLIIVVVVIGECKRVVVSFVKLCCNSRESVP